MDDFDPTTDRPRTDEERQAVVRAQVESGLTIHAWCEDRPYSVQSLNNWRSKWKDSMNLDNTAPTAAEVRGPTSNQARVEMDDHAKARKLLDIRKQIEDLQAQYKAVAATLPEEFVRAMELLGR